MSTQAKQINASSVEQVNECTVRVNEGKEEKEP